MLDVHPPEHTPHTWRDFFIHIATIVVGLLIAIGLEQAVVYLHRRQELTDLRQQLGVEHAVNVATFRNRRQEVVRYVPLLKRDLTILMYLRQHPGASPDTWPGQLSWFYADLSYTEASWKSAQETQALTLLPQVELLRNTKLYSLLDELGDDQHRIVGLLWQAFDYGVRNQAPAAMTPEQLDKSIQSVTDILSLYARMVNTEAHLSAFDPAFQPSPSIDDMRAIIHVKSPLQDQNAVLQIVAQSNQEVGRIEAQQK